MPLTNSFQFTTLFKEHIVTGSFRASRKNRYHCILGLIKSQDQLCERINNVVFDNIKNQSTRAAFETAINEALEEYRPHLEEVTKLGEFLEIESTYIAEIRKNFTKNIYDSIGEVLTNKTFENFTIERRVGHHGGFWLREAPKNTDDQPLQYAANQENQPGQPENITDAIEKNEQSTVELEENNRVLERHFYEPVRQWALKNNDGVNCVITGGRLPFPRWENPDLVQVDAKVGQFTKKIEFEITSYEVKLRVEPYAVWQAANYKRFSSYVYVAFAKTEEDVRGQDGGRVFDIAVDLGVGVLVLENSGVSSPAFREIHAPRRNTPLDAEINSLLVGYSSIEQIHNVIQLSERELESFILPVTATISFNLENQR